MKIELLYIHDCPSWERGLQSLNAALQLESIHADIDLVEIRDNVEATRLEFLGSPSFRVHGRELWPEAREAYALSCRVYPTPEGIKGWPTVEMLREKLHSVAR